MLLTGLGLGSVTPFVYSMLLWSQIPEHTEAFVNSLVLFVARLALVSASIAEDGGGSTARWLLLASFRSNRHELSITHEHLAGILGARRASISQATAALAARDAIENRRNTVAIRDHGRLVECACECYAVSRHAIHTAGA